MPKTPKTKSADYVIIGAGFAGLSTAYHLAQEGYRDILVLEREPAPGIHASGNNAGMIRQTWDDDCLAVMAKMGREAFEEYSRKRKFEFKKRGSILLADAKGQFKLNKTRETLKRAGIEANFLTPEEATQKVPLLKDAAFKTALFCPSDAVVDMNQFLKALLADAQKMGVSVYFGREVLAIDREAGNFRIKTSRETLMAGRVVNAAGAWASSIGEKAGALRIPFRAYKRHIFLTAASKSFSDDWPYVWDLSAPFYFRSFGRKQLLMSPCDKEFMHLDGGKPQDASKIAAERKKELLRKIQNFSENFPELKFKRSWSGLRTLTPDDRFVIGEDPKLPNFYWCAGLGGHGLTVAFSAGRLSAFALIGRKVNEPLQSAFSPERFKIFKTKEFFECFLR